MWASVSAVAKIRESALARSAAGAQYSDIVEIDALRRAAPLTTRWEYM